MLIKTTLHRYHFDVSRAADAKAYADLVDKLSTTPGRGKWLHVLADASKPRAALDREEITIDTAHIHANQWNTTDDGPGRVFDWYEGIYPNRSIKSGHYLDITDEMREVRRNTVACGYCGKQTSAARGLVFCDQCLGSEYLKKNDLYLLKLIPVDEEMCGAHEYRDARRALSAGESAHLTPIFVEAQRATRAAYATAQGERLKRKADKLRADFDEKLRRAVVERDGMIWLLDHGFDVDNWIYYSHTDRFCYGWRDKVSDEDAAKWLAVASEAPFAYEVRGVSRTWESYTDE